MRPDDPISPLSLEVLDRYRAGEGTLEDLQNVREWLARHPELASRVQRPPAAHAWNTSAAVLRMQERMQEIAPVATHARPTTPFPRSTWRPSLGHSIAYAAMLSVLCFAGGVAAGRSGFPPATMIAPPRAMLASLSSEWNGGVLGQMITMTGAAARRTVNVIKASTAAYDMERS